MSRNGSVLLVPINKTISFGASPSTSPCCSRHKTFCVRSPSSPGSAHNAAQNTPPTSVEKSHPGRPALLIIVRNGVAYKQQIHATLLHLFQEIQMRCHPPISRPRNLNHVRIRLIPVTDVCASATPIHPDISTTTIRKPRAIPRAIRLSSLLQQHRQGQAVLLHHLRRNRQFLHLLVARNVVHQIQHQLFQNHS